MNTISDRILFLIEEKKITKTEFANTLNITQAYVSKITNKGATPSDRLMEDICEKFSVNEEWLRTGQGDMIIELPEEDEVAAYVEDLLADDGENELYNIIKAIMRTYNELSPKSQEVLRDASAKLVKNLQKEKED